MSASQLLMNLIAIPSVNPMGQPAEGPQFFETAMTEYLEQWFVDLGVEYRRIEVHPGRCNVVGRYVGDPQHPTVLLDVHQDTVPVDGMTIAPFAPTEEGGRIYGRGACDVKGGMASMLTAFARLVQEQPDGVGDVILSCSCDEEHQMTGIQALADGWTEKGSFEKDWITRKPDCAIICEPTSLDIVIAHRGVTRWKLQTAGRAAHSSRPSEGVNAVYRMAEVLTHLQKYAADLESSIPHPLCGPPTLSVGRIDGGISVNVVPPECTIEIDRRVIPGEDQTTVVDQVTGYLQDRVDFDVRVLPPWCEVGALPNDLNQELADELLDHVQAVVGSRQQIGVPYGTNAAATAAAGVPTVVFGPGSIEQAHTKDEWIEVAQLDQAAEILFRFLTR